MCLIDREAFTGQASSSSPQPVIFQQGRPEHQDGAQ